MREATGERGEAETALSSKTGVITVTSGRCVPPLYGALSTKTSPGCMRLLAFAPLFSLMTVRIDSPIEPRCTGICGAFAINSPFSRFAEAFRSIKLATDLSNYGSPHKVVAITSALPNEGKSTVSEALAQTTAQSGLRTLLIDGDIRNPSLTHRLGRSADVGLIEVVFGKVGLKDALWVDPQTNLHFLPCVVASRFSNSSDLLASAQMQKFFQDLREQYDRIILDLSPLAPVIDVRATGTLADSYILVIEWAKSKVDVVERVIQETPMVRERLMGAVLNKVNVAAMSRYDTHSGGYYRNRYYSRYGYVD